jgi:hypothetical protein
MLNHSSSFLEFGAGGSTMLAADCGVEQIMSVETDFEFLKLVTSSIESINFVGKYFPIYVDIGEVVKWGKPRNRSKIEQWKTYYQEPWRLISNNISPDLILIDGRFRVATFANIFLQHSGEATILFDDYVNRPSYHVVESICPKFETIGRMGVFRKNKSDADKTKFEQIRIFLEHFYTVL